MKHYQTQSFSDSRIATIDLVAISKERHHVTGMIEVDVSEALRQIKERKAAGEQLSFTAWLISVIAQTVKVHEETAAYLLGKNRRIIFNEIKVSMIVEKELDGRKVPIPLLIEQAHERSVESITAQIAAAKTEALTDEDFALQRKMKRWEHWYYRFPGFLRRAIWRYLLRHPKLAFEKMGNVAFTSIGMMGEVKGWFIPTTVHPICFGVSSIVAKPVVVDHEIAVRDILHLTVLMDHDVIDGAPMARFINELSRNLESVSF